MTRSCALILCGLSALAETARADTITIPAQLDNTIYIGAITSNGKGCWILCGRNYWNEGRRGLVQFAVAAHIPPGSTINSAGFSIGQVNPYPTQSTVHLRRVLEAWGEGNSIAFGEEDPGAQPQAGDVTHVHRLYPSNFWATPAGTFSPTTSSSATFTSGTIQFGSTPQLVADVQSFLDNPSGNFGWLLLNNDEVTPAMGLKLASRENSNVAQRPRLVVTYTPPALYSAFCFGDGTGATCPCANSGLAGRGCANSVQPNGALLTAGGNPSLSNDTLVFQGSGMPVGGGMIYFQGTAQAANGAGLSLADGKYCAGGSIFRLGFKFNSDGTSQFPGAGDASLSAAGSVVTPGTTMYYQGCYRDAALSFCPPETFNLTNGMLVNWVP